MLETVTTTSNRNAARQGSDDSNDEDDASTGMQLVGVLYRQPFDNTTPASSRYSCVMCTAVPNHSTLPHLLQTKMQRRS